MGVRRGGRRSVLSDESTTRTGTSWPRGMLVVYRARRGIGVLVACGLLLLLAVCLCACGFPPQVDRSILTGKPCAPPCWAGLVPGYSTGEEVLSTPEASEWVRPGSLGSYDSRDGRHYVRRIGWDDADVDRGGNRAYVEDDLLLCIAIGLDHADLTFGQTVRDYGIPQAVTAILAPWGEFADTYSYEIVLNYPTNGMRFQGQYGPVDWGQVVTGEGKGLVDEQMIVTDVLYYTPGSYEHVLGAYLGYDDEGIESVLRNERPWAGFGQVELACGKYMGRECDQ